MYPSIFFTNSIQTNLTDYVYLKSYNNNTVLIKNFKNRLSLILPSNLIESEFITPLSPEEIAYDEYDYYENNLNAPREDNLYKGLAYSQKHFYRVIDNDLATLPGKELIEFVFTKYINIDYSIDQTSYNIKIGLPVKECRFNYYVNGVLTYPDFDVIIAEPSSSISVNTLQSDYTIQNTVEDVYNNYKLLKQLSTEVILNNIPSADLTISIISLGDVISKTSSGITLTNIPRINYKDDYLNLEDLGWSIFSISNYRSNDYISLLDGIVNNFNNLINNNFYIPPKVIYYDNLPATLDTDTLRYDYYSNSLLLLSFLYAYKDNYTPTFVKYLDNIIPKLLSSINLYTSLSNKELSYNQVPIVINDIATTCLISLILEKYLTVKYNSLVEYVLYTINLQLDKIISSNEYISDILDSDIEESEEFKIDVLFHLIIWAKARNISLDLLQSLLLENLSLITDYNQLSLKTIFKINYLNNILSLNHSDYNLFNYSNFTIQYNENLYGSLQENIPSLLYSSLNLILSNNIVIWLDSSYRSKYTEVETLVNNIFQKSLRFIPVREPWFSFDSLDPTKGVVGLLLKATVSTMIPLFFEYVCYTSSLDINTAYGFGLNKWGNFLGVKRESNEADSIYRHKLKALLSIEVDNYQSIQSFLDAIKVNANTEVIVYVPDRCVIDGEEVIINRVTDLYAKSKLNNPEGVFLTDGSFYELDKELGVIVINSYENDNINKFIMKLSEVYNLPVILKSSISFTIMSSSNIYI